MTEMFGEAWSPMSVPDLAPDDDDDYSIQTLCESCDAGRTNNKDKVHCCRISITVTYIQDAYLKLLIFFYKC